jgi:hypothetical protein
MPVFHPNYNVTKVNTSSSGQCSERRQQIEKPSESGGKGLCRPRQSSPFKGKSSQIPLLEAQFSITAFINRIQLPPNQENSQEHNVGLPKEEGKGYASVQLVEREVQQKKKTMAELDEELRLKLESVSGEGGTAGVEYEAGKAVGLKRGVKENMFRII